MHMSYGGAAIVLALVQSLMKSNDVVMRISAIYGNRKPKLEKVYLRNLATIYLAKTKIHFGRTGISLMEKLDHLVP